MDSVIEISDGEEWMTAGPSRFDRGNYSDDEVVVIPPSSDDLDDDLPPLHTFKARRTILPAIAQPVLSGKGSRTTIHDSDIDQFTSPIQPPAPKPLRNPIPARGRQRSTQLPSPSCPSSDSLSPPPDIEISRAPSSSPIPLRQKNTQEKKRPRPLAGGSEEDLPLTKRGKALDKGTVGKKADGAKEEKALAKARLLAEKQAEKEQKRRLTEANKLRASKSETLREVKMYLAQDLMQGPSPFAPSFPLLKTKFEELSSDIIALDSSPVPGLIQFQRFRRANWDEARGIWVPVDERDEGWVEEGIVGLFIKADELVDKVRASIDSRQAGETEDETIESWIASVHKHVKIPIDRLCPADQIPPTHPTDNRGLPRVMLVIHGLKAYYSKTRSAANREYAAKAKAALAEAERQDNIQQGSGLSKGKRAATKSKGKERLEKDVIERELVKLHLRYGWLQIQVDSTAEITDWMYNMAADIAIRPYKLISKSHTLPLSRESNLKSSSARHALELVLQEIPGVTASGSVGIGDEWRSFAKLMRGYDRLEQEDCVAGGKGESGKAMLAECKVKHLKTGVQNERRIGTAVSRHIWNALRENDPGAPV